MTWWIALGVVAWVGAVVLIVVFVHAANSVAARAVAIDCSWDYKEGLIENCIFRWDAKTKVLTIKPVTPGGYLTVQSNIFDGGGEMTILFDGLGGGSVRNCTVQS